MQKKQKQASEQNADKSQQKCRKKSSIVSYYCHWEIKMLEERKEMESAAPKPDLAGNWRSLGDLWLKVSRLCKSRFLPCEKIQNFWERCC